MSADGLSGERLRTMQIIAGALMMGVLCFAGFVLFTTANKAAGDPMLSYVGVGFVVIALVMQAVMPMALERVAMANAKHLQSAKAEGAAELLVGIYQTNMIISLAFLEAAAFFNLVAYMQSVQWWTLAIVGILLLAMAMKFPTRFKVESWIETKQHELEMGG